MGYGLGRESAGNRAAVRTVLLASGDAHFRTRLRQQLTAMRWQVREAGGGAEAIAQLEMQRAEAMVLDAVLPDLEVGEFAREMRSRHPVMDLLRVNAGLEETGARSPRRNELLHALRQAQEDEHGSNRSGAMSSWALAPVALRQIAAADRLAPGGEGGLAAAEVAALLRSRKLTEMTPRQVETTKESAEAAALEFEADGAGIVTTKDAVAQRSIFEDGRLAVRPRTQPLPDMVGESPGMLELAHMVRLVAPRSTTVLIMGDTGTGKELVARAVHSLSARASKPFVVLNCAAIPESLLEAELFGHTRGAFTGAVQSRAGRIEAAHGGTLFLDEIGEMPLALQAKMLRFLESGELQRVGENESTRVDVRVVAASHQPLQQRAAEGAFRLDLYHRLAVFPVSVPALRDRMEDLLPLSAHLLARLGEEMPVKRLSPGASQRLLEHDWPGNVRELAHVLERGAILAEDRREIAREEVRF
ncbi:MAG TPA: sigma-54 dependent transcriptional regulator [Acidobacteriaceae bacterium]